MVVEFIKKATQISYLLWKCPYCQSINRHNPQADGQINGLRCCDRCGVNYLVGKN